MRYENIVAVTLKLTCALPEPYQSTYLSTALHRNLALEMPSVYRGSSVIVRQLNDLSCLLLMLRLMLQF